MTLVSARDLPGMAQGRLDAFQRHAQIEHNRATDPADKERWAKASRAANAEQARRASRRPAPSAGRADARRSAQTPSASLPEESLDARVARARDALYGDRRTRAKEIVEKLRPELERAHNYVKPGRALPEDPEAVRDRARQVRAEMEGRT
jgi:hypothetical protein